jgi:hypothetical protein
MKQSLKARMDILDGKPNDGNILKRIVRFIDSDQTNGALVDGEFIKRSHGQSKESFMNEIENYLNRNYPYEDGKITRHIIDIV